MCFMQNSAPSQQLTPPPVAPAPTREQVTATAAADAAETRRVATFDAVNQSRAIARRRQGTYGNIRTTPIGDASFGSSSYARFGNRAA